MSNFSKIFIVMILTLSIAFTTTLTHIAQADNEPGPQPVEPKTTDDPTTIIFGVIGGVLVVGGIWYLIRKHIKNNEYKKLREQGKIKTIEEMANKVTIGLSDFEDANLLSKENNTGKTITISLKNALSQYADLILIDGINLESAQNASNKIPYIVMGEVKLFDDIYEVKLGVALSENGQSIYSKKIVSESITDLQSQFSAVAEEIHQKVKGNHSN